MAQVAWVEDLAMDLPGLVAGFGQRPIVVTDSAIAAAGVADPVFQCLGADRVVLPGGEPVAESVGTLAQRLVPGDVAVAVGGGSVIDTVKLAARLVDDPTGLEGRLLGAAPFPAGIGVIALPTTSGSGAEVTRTAIVSHRGRKTWAWDERLRPDLAVLAPALCAATPVPVARAAGLDAFVHAVEAATGRRRTEPIATLGFAAAATIATRLPASLAGDRQARRAMMQAAADAGIAIDHCGTGIGHAVGHALASVGAIPHGLAVMLGLRAGLEWTLEQAGAPYDELAEALGTRVGELPGVVDRMLEAVGFDEALTGWAPPSMSVLVSEMRSVDHLPMRENNARQIGDDDLPVLADLVLRRWMR